MKKKKKKTNSKKKRGKETKKTKILEAQVKKQLNTWTKRKQWTRGADSDLLAELFTIHQQWGLSNLVVAVMAVEYLFAQDVGKMKFVAQALQEIERLRALAKKEEIETPKGPQDPS